MGKTGGFWSKLLAALAVSLVVASAFVVSTAKPASAVGEGTLLSLLNQARASAGLAPLRLNSAMSAVAAGWANYLATSGAQAHNPNERNQIPGGYTNIGEVVGGNFTSPTQAHDLWIAHNPHRQVMLGDFTDVGIAYVELNGYGFAVEDFAKYPVVAPPPPPPSPSPSPSPTATATPTPSPSPTTPSPSPSPSQPSGSTPPSTGSGASGSGGSGGSSASGSSGTSSSSAGSTSTSDQNSTDTSTTSPDSNAAVDASVTVKPPKPEVSNPYIPTIYPNQTISLNDLQLTSFNFDIPAYLAVLVVFLLGVGSLTGIRLYRKWGFA